MMKLGFAHECINPVCECELSGYGYFLNRRQQGILDSLYVRATYLSDTNGDFLILNADLLGLCGYVVREVKARIGSQLSIPLDHIMLLSTHTHCAPSSVYTIGCGEIDPAYIEFLITKMTSAGRKAAEQTYDVRSIRFCSCEIETIGYNRTNPDGPVDNRVYGIAFELAKQRPYALVNYACHPVTLGRLAQVSADFPGQVIAALNASGMDADFFNGCCGDIDPVSNLDGWGSGTQTTICEYGRRIADGFMNAFRQEPLTLSDSIRSTSFSAGIRLMPMTLKDLWEMAEERLQSSQSTGERQALRIWTAMMEQRYLGEGIPDVETNTVQALQIGDALIVGLQGEVFTQIGLDIRSGLAGYPMLLCTNANSATRYIATRENIRARTYGGFSSSVVYAAFPIAEDAAEYFAVDIASGISAWLSEKDNKEE